MDPRYPGRDDFCPEERQQEHSFFHRGPPPPPPRPEDEFGEPHGYGDNRERLDAGFPPGPGRFAGNRFGEPGQESYGGGGADPDSERFAGEDGYQQGGYSPERRPHFPHMGFHRRHSDDAPAPSDDDGGYSAHGAPSQTSYQGEKQYSDEYGAADPDSQKADVVDDAAISSQVSSLSLDLPQGRVVRIFCKQDSAYNLAVDQKTLKMQASNTEDEAQHWIKDASHGFRVKDSYGYPAFSLVNKKTKKVLKHAKTEGQQVLLVDYQADLKDDDILWTESQDFGEGFKTIRAASNTLLNFTVFEGHKKIRNGSALMLDTWHKGDHQVWKLFPV